MNALPHSRLLASEPLVRESDVAEYREGLARFLSGEWDGDRWKGFRVRFGVYGQRHAGVQMIRLKVPGGIAPTAWLRRVAEANRRFAGGDIHVTTRQDFQLYSVPLEKSADILTFLHEGGVPTREAGGNTLRNMTSCELAGICPKERVDAGRAAAQMAEQWLRHPLAQHMPRKVKVAVSGCAADCAAARIHDLGFIAGEKDGVPGFRVVGAGGLGAQPVGALELAPFVAEEDMPAAVEAMMRVHHRHSDRNNRNAARFKFLQRRLGAENLVREFQEEFVVAQKLPHRPWQKLAWRNVGADETRPADKGVLTQHDGQQAVYAIAPLGWYSSDQLEGIAEAAEAAGLNEVRLSSRQRILLAGLDAGQVDATSKRLAALGLTDPLAEKAPADLVSCPGTFTCSIGITNSHCLSEHLLAEGDLPPVPVRVSGCQNSCGMHRVGGIGLHGMAKKIDGRSAPHYQLHIGGHAGAGGGIGVAGPIVPARQASQAIRTFWQAYQEGRASGESLRDWAKRLGADGLSHIFAADDQGAVSDDTFIDFGDSRPFAPPAQTKGDCAAPFLSDLFLADLAKDGLDRLDRALTAGQADVARESARTAAVMAARRVLDHTGRVTSDKADLVGLLPVLRGVLAQEPKALAALQSLEEELVGSDWVALRAALLAWIELADEMLRAPLAPLAVAV